MHLAKNALLNWAAECTGIAVDVDQTDNASGNDLFFAAHCFKDPSSWCKGRILCLNHQNHLGMMQLFNGVFDQKLIGTLYTICAFLNMGAHMLRLILALDRFLDVPGRVVRVVGVPPTAADDAFTSELQSYLLFHVPEARSQLTLKHALSELFAVWNSGFGSAKLTIRHCCGGSACCPDGLNTTKARLRAALHSTALSKSPRTPQVGKWTQLGECVDWFALALTSSFLPELFSFGFQNIKEDSDKKATDVVEGFTLDVSWAAVVGTRKKRRSGTCRTFSKWHALSSRVKIVIRV